MHPKLTLTLSPHFGGSSDSSGLVYFSSAAELQNYVKSKTVSQALLKKQS